MSDIFDMDVAEALLTRDEFTRASCQYSAFAQSLGALTRILGAGNAGPFAQALGDAIRTACRRASETSDYCAAFARALNQGALQTLRSDDVSADVLGAPADQPGFKFSSKSHTVPDVPIVGVISNIADMTSEQLAAIISSRQRKGKLSVERAAQLLPHIREAMREFGITDTRSQVYFLAQTAFESGGFRKFGESGDAEYFARYVNRPNIMGDAKDGILEYLGRGAIQLTGKSNYQTYGDMIGIDLVTHPESAERDENTFRVAAAYWTRERNPGSGSIDDIARGAEPDTYDRISLRINPGLAKKPPDALTERLAHRQKFLDCFEKAFGFADRG